MAEPRSAAGLFVLAGVNGAGKSSLLGALLTQLGVDWFDPDAVARRLRALDPALARSDANAAAWQEGRRLLERAVGQRLTFAIETTLGGNTIPALLARAAEGGHPVRIWYVGLDSPARHLARIEARVARGGHDIPEAVVRERYDRSRENLIRLLPRLTECRVYDNSYEADPAAGARPRPRLLLHCRLGRIRYVCRLERVPDWAKPIVQAALIGVRSVR